MCQHHWVIEEANGPTSPGTCQRCGETKEFQNSTPSGNMMWGNTDSVLNRRLSKYREEALKMAKQG